MHKISRAPEKGAAGTVLPKKSFAVILSAFLLSAILAIGISQSCGAADSRKTVFVAGNPDLYPIEYYDSEKKEYKGVIPEILGAVSERTEIRFEYVSKGRENRQEELAKNKQADMVTAVLLEEDGINVKEKVPVISTVVSGKEITYCIGFSEIASEETAAEIKSALAEISDAEKDGILLSYAADGRGLPKWLAAVILSGTAVAASGISLLTVLFVRLAKKKKEKNDVLVDELTGVGNEKYYLYSFDSLISEQARSLYSGAYIAFDGEKTENMWGKSVREDIEKAAAAHLNTLVSPSEYLSRIDIGVFFLLFQSENEEKTKSRTEEFMGSLNRSLENMNRDWKNLFRCGVCRLCEYPDANAEATVYNAKQGYLAASAKGRSYEICSGKQIILSKNQTRLRSQISDGIKNGEFKIYMQFITESEGGTICGAEVLSRWQNREYGLLQPHEYIGLMKETGKIVSHDYNVFDSVCRQIEKWKNTPFERLFLSCNFTRVSVALPDFAEKIGEIASQYDFPHERIVIEITEDTLGLDSKVISENIKRCSQMGFHVAIDDMGAGFSSLADLYDNEIDVVKIERGFLISCSTPRRRGMLKDMFSLIHNSGAKVICEGIENEEQQEMLRSVGCDMMQGFYYSRVLPLTECERFVSGKSIYQGEMP